MTETAVAVEDGRAAMHAGKAAAPASAREDPARAARRPPARRGAQPGRSASGPPLRWRPFALATSSAWLIDRAAERPGLTALTAAMCLVQFLAFSKAGLRYFERLGTHDLAFRVLGRLRVRFFATLARLAPAGLGGERSGDVLSRSVDDVDRLQNLYLLVLPLSLAGALTVAAAVCVAALLVPRAGAALAVGLLINAVVVPVLAHHVARAPAQRVARAWGEIAADVADLLAAAPELAASGLLAPALERIEALDATMRRSQMPGGTATGGMPGCGCPRSRSNARPAAAAHAGGSPRRRTPRVDVAVLPVLGLAAFESIANLPAALSKLPADVAAGARLLELERRPTPVSEPSVTLPLAAGPGRVTFDKVTVRYAGAHDVALRALSCEVGEGRRLGIAGASGSGKSTVASALLRFIDPESGRVLLGATDTAEVSGQDVRRVVGALSGDDHVFAGFHPGESGNGQAWRH